MLLIRKKSVGLIKRGRYEYWKAQLGSLGNGTIIRGRLHIERPENVEIGRCCVLNEGVSINARAAVQIKDHVRLSAYAMLIAGELEFASAKPPYYKHRDLPITIEEGVWVGAGAQVLPGVTVGRHSIVAAGAVVTRDVPSYTVVGGVPARIIKQISLPESQETDSDNGGSTY